MPVMALALSAFMTGEIHAAERQDALQTMAVRLETDTSIIYDLGMMPARQLPQSTFTNNNPQNPYRELKAPTQIIRQDDYYFIVDCYHNQVIYARNLETPINEWRIMTNNVTLPHSIASDGERYLVTDTEENRILVFEKIQGRFQNTQTFEQIGNRPHYIKYDRTTDSYFAWSSLTGDMYILKNDERTDRMCIQEVRHIKELADCYVRSFTIVGDHILFPSGNNCYMILADKETMDVKQRYPVTQEISGMAYVMPIGDSFYITVSTDLRYNQNAATMIRTDNLALLAEGQYEKIYEVFQTKGVPYYIDSVNGMYYMTNHNANKSIIGFGITDGTISPVIEVY